MRKEVNLNHDYIFLSSLDCGQTVFKVKVGRSFYNVYIRKNAINSIIGVSDNKCNYVQYSISLRNNYIIDRKFIENIKKISEAETILKTFDLI